MFSEMTKKEFFKKTVLGGLVVVLPIAILSMGIKWLFKTVTDIIQPFTNLFVNTLGLPELVGDIIVIAAMGGVCFSVGILVTTKGGSWFHLRFDERLAKLAPGYRLIKDVVGQFFGDASKSPFANGEVALVQIFGVDNPTQVIAIVTSKHENGDFTIFMATGPNPTSGNIYHVKKEQVTLCPEVKIEDAMRTIIACGAGSGELFNKNVIND